ncbi:MAG: hypothetical protein KJ061_19500, partial [Vicinamibacteraceae bacterium]|nr:hypothetical protein [Vicinamibacteraceae bacterium]
SLSASSFTGPGTVTLTAAANASVDSRSAGVTVAGQTVTITQSGQPPVVCLYAVSPDDVNVPARGSSGEVAVVTSPDCPWDAVSHDTWITVAGTNPRKGSGSAAYTVDAHTGPVGRLGRLTVAGTEVLVHQAADAPSSCTYKVEPTLAQLAWQHTAANMIVTTGDGCPWTVATDTPWLTLTTPASMTGPGMATVTMSLYKELAPREGIVQVRWPTETAGQNVVVRQFGCGYSVNPAIVNVPAAGGRATATVFGATQASFSMIECPWRLSTAVSWLRLNTTTGEGLSPVSFDVDANTTGLDRCGSVVMSDPDVARASFQVCQAK